MPASELRNMAAEAREPSPTGFITVFFLVPLFPSSAPLTQGFDANRERERGVSFQVGIVLGVPSPPSRTRSVGLRQKKTALRLARDPGKPCREAVGLYCSAVTRNRTLEGASKEEEEEEEGGPPLWWLPFWLLSVVALKHKHEPARQRKQDA